MQPAANQSHHPSPGNQQQQQAHGTSIQNLVNFVQPDSAQPRQQNRHASGGNTPGGGQNHQHNSHQSQQQQGHHRQQSQQQSTGRVDRVTKNKYSLEDFTLQRTLGTGSFGRVHLAQSKHNHRFYAMKVMKKAQIVKMKQIEHTNDERRMLSRARHSFLITLWGTWQDSRNLYMVMDFVEGGELFSLLRKSQVSLFSLCAVCGVIADLWVLNHSVSPILSPNFMRPKWLLRWNIYILSRLSIGI